ncbi:PucR family transcriptional regulator [Gordonia sp. NPDC003376]
MTDACGRPWPTTSDDAVELIRRSARIAMDGLSALLEAVDAAMLSAVDMELVATDPVMRAAAIRSNRSLVTQWLVETIADPRRPVEPHLGNESLVVARELVRRGMNATVLDSYRSAQSAAWLHWMGQVFTQSSDPALIRAALELSARSIDDYLEATISSIQARMEVERQWLTHGSQAERREVVALVLEGAPIDRARASHRLGYGLDRRHVAAVIWSEDDEVEAAALDHAATSLAAALGGDRPLTVIGGSATLWVWVPVGRPEPVRRAPSELIRSPGVRTAIGRNLPGMDGFRRSHLDALAVQRMMTRLRTPQPAATFDDAELSNLMSQDLERATQFVRVTLGDLATANEAVQSSVLAYIESKCNAVRAAERLHVHRNTLVRNLARAEELLPVPLDDNVVRIAAALDLIRWQRRIGAAD